MKFWDSLGYLILGFLFLIFYSWFSGYEYGTWAFIGVAFIIALSIVYNLTPIARKKYQKKIESYDKLEEEYDKIVKKIGFLESELKRYESESQLLKAENSELKAQVNLEMPTLKHNQSVMETEKALLKQQIAELQNEKHMLSIDKIELSKETAEQRFRIAELQDKQSKGMALIDECNRKQNQLENDNNQLENEISIYEKLLKYCSLNVNKISGSGIQVDKFNQYLSEGFKFYDFDKIEKIINQLKKK